MDDRGCFCPKVTSENPKVTRHLHRSASTVSARHLYMQVSSNGTSGAPQLSR
jgi:hypothetical protein